MSDLQTAFKRLAEAFDGKQKFIYREMGGSLQIVLNGSPFFSKVFKPEEFTQDDADAILEALGMWWECERKILRDSENKFTGYGRWISSAVLGHSRFCFFVSEELASKRACAEAATIAAINFYLDARQ